MIFIKGKAGFNVGLFYKYHLGIFESIKRFSFSLKVVDDHIIYLCVLALLFVFYFMITPLMNWLITLQSVRFLSYFVCSLFMIIILLLLPIGLESSQTIFQHVGKITLHCLSAFGFALLGITLIQNIRKYKN